MTFLGFIFTRGRVHTYVRHTRATPAQTNLSADVKFGVCVWRAVTLRFVCVWVPHRRVLGYARVAFRCAQVCMQDMIRAQFKMKCKRRMVLFHVYYPPAVVCCFNVFICNLYVTCMYVVCMSPFVFLCILMLLVSTRMLLLCTRMSLACTLVHRYDMFAFAKE